MQGLFNLTYTLKKGRKFAEREPLFLFFFFLLGILSLLNPSKIIHYPSYVNWQIIINLAILLMLTTGIEESAYFHAILQKVLSRVSTERALAFYIILSTIALSTFIINDVALFIVVPLTISLKTIIKNNIFRLVIFEAIAVNVGSLLTPIGNPQNLFLWHKWNVSFASFVKAMLPLFIFLCFILLVFIFFSFRKKKIIFEQNSSARKTVNIKLLGLSIGLFIIYLAIFELKKALILLPAVFIIYFLTYRKILKRTDWFLLCNFIVIFIVVHIISTLPFAINILGRINLQKAGNVFFFSAFISQIISNVPASVFMAKFNHNWHAISYGVNIGANGVLIASLANFIALRIAKIPKLWLSFHKYSIPYFLLTFGCVYLWFLFR